MTHTAKFVPTAGYLLCPDCNERITDSTGTTTIIHETAGVHWESARKKRWQCDKCHSQITLPVNPFRTAQEARP